MKNKELYYTPTIKEFHVGFELESNYIIFSKDKQWQSLLLTEQNISLFLDCYIQDAVKEEFRVKYLDKEDIESLGWKVDGLGEIYTSFNLNNFDLTMWDGNYLEISGNESNDSQNSFNGTCKNKSELIKLMKQLEI